jgi:hypothetical protein
MQDNGSTQINPELAHAPVQEEGNSERLLFGIIAGIVAAAVGAIIWALITVWTKYQIGWMAIGVGCLTGFAIRFFGKGSSIKFGIIGALLAVLGCMAGNFLASCIFTARDYDVSVFQVLSIVDFSTVIETLKQNFVPLDILFYALAIYTGFRFSYKIVKKPKKNTAT